MRVDSTLIESFDLRSLRLSKNKDLLIYDEVLYEDTLFKNFISSFKFKLSVKGKDHCKGLSSFEDICDQVLSLSRENPFKSIISLGGGSVGDMVGNLAGLWKRGVSWKAIPTTWLSAIDSSYGGKTALNLNNSKNQLGLFYPPETVYLVQDVLEKQPFDLKQEGIIELLKVFLISKDTKWSNFVQNFDLKKFELGYISEAVFLKIDIVKKDPYEKFGPRKFLNFGHTLGHVLELILGISHGEAVKEGILFSLWISKHENLISDLKKMGFSRNPKIKVSRSHFIEVLKDDKKRVNDEIDFILLEDLGRPKIIKMSFNDIIKKASDYGIISEEL